MCASGLEAKNENSVYYCASIFLFMQTELFEPKCDARSIYVLELLLKW